MSSPASNYGWGTVTDMENKVGVQNVLSWSNPSGVTPTSTRNDSVVQYAINYADATIYGKFRNQGNYSYPLSPFGGGILIVNQWWVLLACWSLYTTRGFRDDKDRAKYSVFQDQAMSDMGEYLSGTKILDATPRWPQSSGPVAIT